MTLLRLAGLFPLIFTAHAETLFQDTFARPDSRDIQATLDGITNNTGTTLAAGAVYTQPWLDPNNRAPIFGPEDGAADNGGGALILAEQLQLAVGSGTSNAFVNHNFTNPSIVAAGGFSVSLDVVSYSGVTFGQGGGFAIGMSQAEAAATGDPFNGTSRMVGGFETGIGATVAPQVISDFWVLVRGNNTVVWGGRSGTVAGVTGLPSKTGTLAVNFRFDSFTAGSPVDYEILLDGLPVGTGGFAWSKDSSNHIGIEARDPFLVILDHLTVATDFVESPEIAPLINGLEATRLFESFVRFHWDITPGTTGDPGEIAITAGGETLHAGGELSGFIDVDAGTATEFSLTVSNAAGSDQRFASLGLENAYSAAVRAANPTAWYRFNEAAGSPFVVDSAENFVPHNGTIVGGAVTGLGGPTDGAISFPGSGGVTTDLILNPGAAFPGYTIEATVRRSAAQPALGVIVAQADQNGTGRNQLMVGNDGRISTLMPGGFEQRKDADGTLPAEVWAHLVMVVDNDAREIRWYLDGEPIGSTIDGMNPDGTTFDPNVVVESSTGGWRIGVHKGLVLDPWLGEMDDIAIYEYLLDDPDGDGEMADSLVETHSAAWYDSTSGLLGFSTASGTIGAGESTTLTVRVAADATSVTIDQGIGTVVPVDGVVTVPVSPSATTVYTVTVESPAGTQIQTVTVEVTSAPSVPAEIISTSVTGGNLVIQFRGSPDTGYRVRSSDDLVAFDGDLGIYQTDAEGLGTVEIPLVPGISREFYRIETSP